MKVARLRAACIGHKFAMEPLPAKGAYKLIDLEIGHAVMNDERRSLAFSVRQAMAYFRTLDRGADSDQPSP